MTPSLLLNYDPFAQALSISPRDFENAPRCAQDALQSLLEQLPDLLASFQYQPVCARLAHSIILAVQDILRRLQLSTGIQIELDIGNLKETMIRAAPAYRADRYYGLNGLPLR
jgi:hypothetical protein